MAVQSTPPAMQTDHDQTSSVPSRSGLHPSGGSRPARYDAVDAASCRGCFSKHEESVNEGDRLVEHGSDASWRSTRSTPEHRVASSAGATCPYLPADCKSLDSAVRGYNLSNGRGGEVATGCSGDCFC